MTSRSGTQFLVGLVFLLLPGFVSGQAFETFVDFHPTKDQFDFDRWPYELQEETNARLQELARKYPNIARSWRFADSRQGAEMWMIEITNRETGPGESKPGLWLEAGVHPDELPGPPYMRYFIERALAMYGTDPVVTRLIDTRTFYVVPNLNPDGHRISLTSQPSWPGHNPEDHPGRDLNGDGFITSMRWKENPDDEEYRIITEGTLPDSPEHRDPLGYVWRQQSETHWQIKDRDRHWTGRREEPDYNRNFAAEWVSEDPGAGEFPFSLPEIYGVAKEMTSRNNIFFMHDVHAANVGREWMIRPLSNGPYQAMHHEDNDFYVRLAQAWAYLSPGDQTYSDFYTPNGTGATIGGLPPDWAYLHLGIFGFGAEVGGSGRDYDGNSEVLPDERERWHQEEMGGRYARPWEPYDHPVLGRVEIGGGMVGTQGMLPPSIGDIMERRNDNNFKFLMYAASLAPELRVEVSSEPGDDGTYRVSATVRNDGWLSTYVTRRALEIGGSTIDAGPGAALSVRRRDFPALVELSIAGGELVDGEARQEVGHLLGKWGRGRAVRDGRLDGATDRVGAGKRDGQSLGRQGRERHQGAERPMRAMRAVGVMARSVVMAMLVFSFLAPMAGGQGVLDAIDGELSDINYDFGRWPYPLYVEVTKRLQELAREYPKLTTLHSIGKTAAGRDMWLMEVTNSATGAGETKPGLWIDGNLHAHELNTRVRSMYFLERLLAGHGRDAASRLARACSRPTRRERPERGRIHQQHADQGSRGHVVREPARRPRHAAVARPRRRPLELRSNRLRRREVLPFVGSASGRFDHGRGIVAMEAHRRGPSGHRACGSRQRALHHLHRGVGSAAPA